jgi:Kef-type K+ transport system membrane component KefB
MTSPAPTAASRAALDRLDRANRRVTQTIILAAAIESILLVFVLLVIDFADPLHRLVFLLAMLTYCTLALAIVALGAHVSRVQERLLTALELLREAPGAR